MLFCCYPKAGMMKHKNVYSNCFLDNSASSTSGRRIKAQPRYSGEIRQLSTFHGIYGSEGGLGLSRTVYLMRSVANSILLDSWLAWTRPLSCSRELKRSRQSRESLRRTLNSILYIGLSCGSSCHTFSGVHLGRRISACTHGSSGFGF